MPDQSMAFQALVKNKTPEVKWFLDGILYARTSPPFTIYWNLTRGVHTLMAVHSKGIGNSISFSVD
jgi:membrane carboxypeptidase/penicillin-binding protein PbpC